jgi:hypothetical protein
MDTAYHNRNRKAGSETNEATRRHRYEVAAFLNDRQWHPFRAPVSDRKIHDGPQRLGPIILI